MSLRVVSFAPKPSLAYPRRCEYQRYSGMPCTFLSHEHIEEWSGWKDNKFGSEYGSLNYKVGCFYAMSWSDHPRAEGTFYIRTSYNLISKSARVILLDDDDSDHCYYKDDVTVEEMEALERWLRAMVIIDLKAYFEKLEGLGWTHD